jgi:RNA polymerase sigma-70 factor (ECF subfamily)
LTVAPTDSIFPGTGNLLPVSNRPIAASSSQGGFMVWQDGHIFELMSRSIDADLTPGERGDLDRLLAQDRRAATAMAGMSASRRSSQEIRTRDLLPEPGFFERLRKRIAGLLSQYPPELEVIGRVMPAHQADFQLAMDAAQGRDQAWNQIFKSYSPGISALIYQHGFKAEQEDLLQDIFLLLCRKIDSFRGDSSLKTWIFRVSVNHLNNYRSRVHAKRKQELSESQLGGADDDEPLSLDDFTADEGPNPEQALERKLAEESVFSALATIPEEVRTAIVLRDLNELSYQEIATIMEIPEGTVKSRVARGRAVLAKKLMAGGLRPS